MKERFAQGCILGAAAAWGCIGLFSRRLLLGGVSAENIVVLRNFGSLLVLLAVFAVRDRSVFRVEPRHLPIFFGTGVVSVVLFTLCYFHAQQLCSLATAAILLYTAPAMVVLMSVPVLHEKLTRRKLCALALAFAGCLFVSGVLQGGLSLTPAGLLFGLGAAFFYALYSIFSPFALRRYSPMAVVVWSFVFAGLGALFLVDPGNLRASFADRSLIPVAAGLVLVSTVLPYLLYTRGLSEVESGKASILASLEPVVASFVGILVYGEPMSLSVAAGLGCILGCVFILR